MTKMTYSDALALAISVLGADEANDAVVNRLNALKATLDKRAAAPRKPSKADLAKAEADAKEIARIREVLSMAPGASCKEIANELGDLSVPKVAALLRKMGAVKTDERTPGYFLPEDAPEDEIPDEVEA